MTMTRFNVVLVILSIFLSLYLCACGGDSSQGQEQSGRDELATPRVNQIQALADSLPSPALDSFKIHLAKYQDYIRTWYKSNEARDEAMSKEMEIIFDTQVDNYQLMKDFYLDIQGHEERKEATIQLFQETTTYWEEKYEKMNPKASNLYEEIIKAKRTFVGYDFYDAFTKIRRIGSRRTIY